MASLEEERRAAQDAVKNSDSLNADADVSSDDDDDDDSNDDKGDNNNDDNRRRQRDSSQRDRERRRRQRQQSATAPTSPRGKVSLFFTTVFLFDNIECVCLMCLRL